MITKDQLKTLTAADPKLNFWTAVILGEICEIVNSKKSDNGGDIKPYWSLIEYKVTELDGLIIQRAIEQATEKLNAENSEGPTKQA